MPPTFIHDATDFDQAVTIGTTTEGLFLDFKQTINAWDAPKGTPDEKKREARKELCRDVSQFANTSGGCMLLGIEEVKNAANIKVAVGIKTVSDPDRMRAWIEEAIKNYCVPSTFTHEIQIVRSRQDALLAVNIRPHLHTVYVWDRQDETIEVVARTSHGKRRLNPNELERHIMNSSRATKLMLEQVKAASTRGQVQLLAFIRQRVSSGQWDRMEPYHVEMTGVGETAVQLALRMTPEPGTRVRLTVPLALIKVAWLDEDGLINLVIEQPLIFRDDKLRFGTLNEIPPQVR